MSGFWSGRGRDVDPAVHAAWKASLTAQGVRPGRLLTWAAAADGRCCLATAGMLSIGSADGPAEDWRHLGWHRIERGGFDADTLTLRWTLYGDGPYGSAPDDLESAIGRGEVVLTDPRQLPAVFRDRVAASIAVEQFFELDSGAPGSGRHRSPGRGVVVSGRRDLGRRDARLEWHASLSRGTRWQQPGVRELGDRAISRLRAEYDPEG